MKPDVEIRGIKVTLTSIKESDATDIVRWRSDPSIIKYFFNRIPITMEGHMEWYNNCYLKDDDRIDFMMHTADGRAIGTAGIKGFAERSPEVSYAVCEAELRGQGLGKDAVQVLIRYAKERGADAVRACIRDDNEVSIGLVKKLGFRCAGKMQEQAGASVYRMEL